MRTTTALIDHAHDRGIRVWWRHMPPRDAYWSLQHRSIWLRPGLTDAQTRSLLAHELGHAAYGDEGAQLWAGEARAWRYAARLLIVPDHYEEAERLHGPHIGGLALALDVTPEIVTAYQDTLERAA